MLTPKKSHLVPSFDDIVFEHRNRSYGAYLIRRDYDKNVVKAFLITVGAVLLITSHSLIKDLFLKAEMAVTEIPEVEITFNKRPEIYDPIPDQPKVKIELPSPSGNSKPLLSIPVVVAKDSLAEESLRIDSSSLAVTPGPVTGGTKGPFKPGNDTIGGSTVSVTVPVKTPTDFPDVMPEFPGGESELFKFLTKSIKYPKIPLQEGIQANVYVAFVVGEEGNISEIEIIRPGGYGFDEEVVRVVKKMPRWKPGKMKGKDVAVRFRMPVKFKLQRN